MHKITNNVELKPNVETKQNDLTIHITSAANDHFKHPRQINGTLREQAMPGLLFFVEEAAKSYDERSRLYQLYAEGYEESSKIPQTQADYYVSLQELLETATIWECDSCDNTGLLSKGQQSFNAQSILYGSPGMGRRYCSDCQNQKFQRTCRDTLDIMYALPVRISEAGAIEDSGEPNGLIVITKQEAEKEKYLAEELALKAQHSLKQLDLFIRGHVYSYIITHPERGLLDYSSNVIADPDNKDEAWLNLTEQANQAASLLSAKAESSKAQELPNVYSDESFNYKGLEITISTDEYGVESYHFEDAVANMLGSLAFERHSYGSEGLLQNDVPDLTEGFGEVEGLPCEDCDCGCDYGGCYCDEDCLCGDVKCFCHDECFCGDADDCACKDECFCGNIEPGCCRDNRDKFEVEGSLNIYLSENEHLLLQRLRNSVCEDIVFAVPVEYGESYHSKKLETWGSRCNGVYYVTKRDLQEACLNVELAEHVAHQDIKRIQELFEAGSYSILIEDPETGEELEHTGGYIATYDNFDYVIQSALELCEDEIKSKQLKSQCS